jgi:flavin reductase (DIM6/NTAB) family NADH-FMN oxidoreductase RutF
MSGALLLDGALAVLECRTEQVVRAGDHDLTIGAVTALELGAGDVEPLVYHRRSYRSLAPREGR